MLVGIKRDELDADERDLNLIKTLSSATAGFIVLTTVMPNYGSAKRNDVFGGRRS